MKQHITIEQLSELSEPAKEKLTDWCHSRGYVRIKEYEDHFIKLPGLLSIGQMIEFLNEKQEYQFHILRRTFDWKVIVNDLHFGKELGGELCDHLWEACKEVLEDE